MDEIAVCNSALDLIGQGLHIASFTDDTRESESCNRLYAPTVQRCLEKGDWSFARRSVQITSSMLSAQDASPFKFAYKLPDDFIRALFLQPGTAYDGLNVRTYAQDTDFDYRVTEGEKTLITHLEAPFVLVYQSACDEALFPSAFTEYIEFSLAARLAADIIKGTEGVQIAQALMQKADTLLASLKENDPPAELPVDGITSDILALTGQGVGASLGTKRRMVSHVARRFPDILRRTLELYPWSFLRKSTEITAGDKVTDSVEPLKNAYRLPSDCSKVLFLTPANTEKGLSIYDTDTLFDYRVTDERLLITSLTAPFTVSYCAVTEDETLLPTGILEAVKLHLAADLLTNFFRQKQTQTQSESNGVGTNDAQLLITKAESILTALQETDPPVELPVDSLTSDILALTGQGVNAPLEVRRRMVSHVTRRFPDVLKRVLELYPWSFTRRSVELRTSDAVTDRTEPLKNAYRLPSDCSKVLFLTPANTEKGLSIYDTDTLFDYRVTEERLLITPLTAPFTVNYCAVVTDQSLLPSAVTGAVKLYLASDLIVNFFGQKRTQQGETSDGVGVNDAQLLIQKAEALIASLKESDPPPALPVDPVTADILALTGQSAASLAVKRHAVDFIARRFKEELNSVEELHPWDFCRRSATLAATREQGIPLEYVYTLPEDCIKVLYVVPPYFEKENGKTLFCIDPLFDYRTDESRHLITSAEGPLGIVYQARIGDTALLPSGITEAVKYRVASDYITNFFGQRRTQNEVTSEGVSVNDAQLLWQKAESLLNSLWENDRRPELPVDDRIKRVADILGVSIRSQDLDVQRRLADAVCRIYSENFRRALQQFNWSFARRDEVITEDYLIEDAVSLPWKYTYSIPEDVMRILFLTSAEADHYVETASFPDPAYIDFTFRNLDGKKVLVTDAKPGFAMHYQALVEDEELIDPLLRQGLDYMTASQLAPDFGENSSQGRNSAQAWLQMALQCMERAAARDAQQGAYSVKNRVPSGFVMSRRF